ncbi:MAG: ribonucleoside-diphosphate reductase subunit alpha, partial [Flavobacteriales bacterium]|nr:ribonucleoside-diphosphate reductase subunit alpha [Flavobacteriales bacterium]
VEEAYRNLYDGIPVVEVANAMTLSARSMVEKDPNYSYVAARLLFQQLYQEAHIFLGIDYKPRLSKALYKKSLKAFITKGIELEILTPKLADFDLDKLGDALKPERDSLVTYLGAQTLYDRYFTHKDGVHYETPQVFFMRVAMGLALEEDNIEERAIEFYNQLSSMDYMTSTPTLFNSATMRSQLSSCFLSTVSDDLDGIFAALADNAQLSKFAGGLGTDWTSVRGMGSHIKGTNGKSSGVIPFLYVANAATLAVNQGGRRRGAKCAYLESWHMDIEEFLDLRKNTGDERRRTHDMNTANWIPDLLMKRVFEEGKWTLFSPDTAPDLHELYGQDFEKAYIAYEERAERGEIPSRTIEAKKLWRKMLGMLFETGHPWITFKDPCNLRSPQQHAGVIHSSNLCTEITLNTSKDEIAVCNLGSVNLAQHIDLKKGTLNKKKLEKTVTTAIRMLDNVIDINYYAVPQAKNSNLKHRPIGMGMMGFQDALHLLQIPYASDKAVQFADESMELISYYAIKASAELAKERGTYKSYKGSLWSKGILPIDSIKKLAESRGQYFEQDMTSTLDWDSLRELVKTNGMRNSNVLAIAPTATIANICGVSQSIEPTYQNLFVKSNLSGEFTVINPHLVRQLKEMNLWDEVMVADLKYYDGSLEKIDRVPEELKAIYATAFAIDPKWLVEAASRRQKWIDQAQSLNLYMAQASGKKLDLLYRKAWLLGLKTTYYLRSLGATSAEKSTVSDGALNAVAMPPKACAIDDPDCEACQ